ncbi:acyl-CoA dehydrogenase [Paractinoplanes rishiriensis]|uniref:Acyl-CoA dehydrogenase n=1 Tax=Paractinoplanes rishiriensis TaxID=1050105 RepID=A0A919K1T8_9ACTN|nr:acyl-CoA dehydrogenase [Actinoplanes rishiriensis]GIE97667.1 acyl-CoA dehydrogenase [Actinoplanes rishiriensis]
MIDLPLPGGGDTWKRWSGLAATARKDLAEARLGEGHADAVAILAEVGGPAPEPGARWGVWTAKPLAVRAERGPDGWLLTGDRPCCPGAAWCTHALVTAAAGDEIRLFAVRTEPPHALPLDGTRPAAGMATGGKAAGDSRTVRFTSAPAQPVGGPGAYLDRPGFWHRGIGVAACWFGGAQGIADPLYAAARERNLGPHAFAHLGGVDAALGAARAVLREAAGTVDRYPKADAHRLALRTRATVEAAATEVIDRVGRALGADPPCHAEAHARRVADLIVYLRQSHAEADLDQLGRLAAKHGELAW